MHSEQFFRNVFLIKSGEGVGGGIVGRKDLDGRCLISGPRWGDNLSHSQKEEDAQ